MAEAVSRMAENTPGGQPVNAPALIAQGADDPFVLPTVRQPHC